MLNTKLYQIMKHRLAIILATAVCYATSLMAKDGLAFFEREIRPILANNCYDCHSSTAKVKGGLRLDTGADIEVGGDTGPVIVKGEPNASRLIEAVRYQNRDLQMPPKNSLSPDAVKKLEQWVALGAPMPTHRPSERPRPPHGMSVEESRQFWSFRPLSFPPVPSSNSEFVRNPIDAFIQERLTENGLSPAPRADKRTLIRRVTQDLTGLPPAPHEIDDFLSDTTPDAFEKLVERLLNSPHYGVRWGRHWLDVARYSDSNGLDENIGFGNAWRYRDYVVEAFNNDKPYDRFLVEQVAGDLLPNANHQTITATGYLQLGPKVLAEPDIEKLQLDVIDEQLDTLGKTFLGLTIGCARCHDHKFDPIKQTDYYSLAAIFKGTKTFGDQNMGAIKFWYEHPIATDEDKERIKSVDAELKRLNAAAASFKNKQIAEIRRKARAQPTDYLVACTEFDLDTPLEEIKRIAEPTKLHARILHHCRRHLEYHRDDPIFKPWHEFIKAGQTEDLRHYYTKLFDDVEQALAEARKKDPKTKTLPDPGLDAARAALYDNAGFLAVPNVDAFALDQTSLAEYYRLLSIARAFESSAPDIPALMGVSDGKVADTVPVLIRGNRKSPGQEVSRGFPAAIRLPKPSPAFSENGSGRLELAHWMADPQHPLTARVMINRLWTWHFGKGLVASTENFGIMGDRPSNPQLLDWLAKTFIRSGWSIKTMHRLILSSNTWQMASHHPQELSYASVDPENRFHWKQNLRRLEAEQIRDSILAVAGRLDLALGGKTLPLRNRQFVFNHTSEDHTTYDSLRRALYLPVIRNNLYPLFAQFDFPDPTMPTGSRHETVIAPQALVMLNDPLILDSARAMARGIMQSFASAEQRFAAIHRHCLGRPPSQRERERGEAFLRATRDQTTAEQAWTLLCQSVIASNEFLYLK